MHTTHDKAFFAPQLSLTIVAPAVEFYQKAFGAEVLMLIKNEDDSIHVAELLLQGAVFHLHQEMPNSTARGPQSVGGTTVDLGLFLDDPDALMDRATAAGGRVIHPMTTHEYGYRQGTLEDPFGHRWTFQKQVGEIWKGVVGPEGEIG